MEPLLIYLLKSTFLLSVFFFAYTLLLKKDTTFLTNRFFLLAGIATAFILPLIEFTRTIFIDNELADLSIVSLQVENSIPTSNETFNWWKAAGIVYFAGLGILFLFFVFQASSLLKILSSQPGKKREGFTLIELREDIQPFSFFRYIIYNPDLHSSLDLKLILEHEKTHARQWHSADVLLSTIVTGLLWFNPLSWLYKKNLVQNLEYLTDRETVAIAGFRKEYQKTLLKVSISDHQPVFTSNFYQSFIKKRIMMLNKTSTPKKNAWKTALVLPFLFVFVLGFQIRTVAQNTPEENATEKSGAKEPGIFILKKTSGELKDINASQYSTTVEGEQKEVMLREINRPVFILNGEIQAEGFSVIDMDPEDIKSLNVLKKASAVEKYGEKAKNGAVEIILKSAGNKSGPASSTKNSTSSSEGTPKNTSQLSEEENKSNIEVFRMKKIELRKPSETEKPLYVLDDKVLDENFDTSKLDPNDIKFINVLKGSNAVEKYGEKAAHGAIEIFTKEKED